MELDLETFLITLYVITDDWYQTAIRPKLPACGGPAPKLCDSEVLCLALAAQWRNGVPWKSERSFARYALRHWRPFFPGMTSQSAFNRRVRWLWGAFIMLQQISAHWLTVADCEVPDCVPVRVAHGSRSFHPVWLADMARIGKGGTDRYFYGLYLLLVVSASGLPSGWTLAVGNVQDRWLSDHPWFSALRQVVETAFAHLCDSFGLLYPGAHFTWGLITRIAAKLAAYTVGIDINRLLGRPDFAFAILIS